MPDLLTMPGGTLITRLKVYDTPTPDGQRGGTPHMHLLCSEMYFVLAGSGAVEVIDRNGFSRVELQHYSAFLFSPGTIHRLINPNGDLELLVIMANSGLPERGDNVVTFETDLLADQAAYDAAMRVTTLDEAYTRRDRGVRGFLTIKAAFARSPEEGQAALSQFYQAAAARTADRLPEWRTIIRDGAHTQAEHSLENLDRLSEGSTGFLQQATQSLIPAAAMNKLGFCGHLNRYFDPATLSAIYTAEGVTR
mgnify:FL=1